MAKVYNPTVDCKINHCINGNQYVIPPMKTAEVRDHDVDDLLTLLAFLVVIEDGGAGKQRVLDSKTHQPVWKTVDIKVEEEKAKKSVALKLKCDKEVLVRNERTGRKNKKIKCGYETNSKKAMLGHIKKEHTKPKVRLVKDKDDDEL